VSQTAGLSTWEVVGSATYAEKGLYTVTVTVNDIDGTNTLTTRNTSINVADAHLTDTTTAGTVNATRGTSTGDVVLATFSDANPYATAADFSINVTWVGTGNVTLTVTLVLVSHTAIASNWEVLGSAIFDADGNFTAVVTITDVDGLSLTSKKTKFHVTG
jgi:hypothetical protein